MTAQAKKETLEFSAEIGKVLHLMINSLYTHKEIFLRELLSNASDACDKLRYKINTDEKVAEKFKNHEFKIKIEVDSKNKAIVISDNGIGMSRNELIENLGTIAKSGTQKFIENLSADNKKNNQLIGQFGVGFYSCFMVGKKVKVISAKYNSTKAHSWESDGQGKYSINEEKEKIQGTKIIISLKSEEEAQYLNKFHIKHVVKTYSEHISFPIEFNSDEEGTSPETLNENQVIWAKAPAKVKKEEYNAFYKTVAHAIDEPWITIHNKVEGAVEYTNLLFIPNKRPMDLFHPDRKTHVKLYVKRIFITEDNVELIPAYLRFLRGIVDSQDLPLNISRETLQNNLVIDKIRNSIVKKVFSELKKKLDKDRKSYEVFWDNFGAVLKEGLCEYTVSKEDILDLCMFKTSKSDGKFISLKEYIERMQEGQDNIYYLIGTDYGNLALSPQIEKLKKKDIEVIFLVDGVDDFWLTTEQKYHDKVFKSVTKFNDETSSEEEKSESKDKKSDKKNKEFDDILKFMQESLKANISEVRLSNKLVSSPVCLAVAEGSMDIRMERMLLEQGQIAERSKKILEINPKHKIVKSLVKIFGSDKKKAKEITNTLYDQACIVEGEAIDNPNDLAKRITSMLELSLSA